MVNHIISISLFLLIGLASAAPINDFDVYRYSLELNKDSNVCRHMERVFNKYFQQPWNWDYRTQPMVGAFPLLPNVEHDAVLAGRLRYSRYPSSPEFDAIEWREGRSLFREAPEQLAPILVAVVDIDNDGTKDLVVKTQFMVSIRPGGGSSPGGEDAIYILPTGAFDLDRPLERNLLWVRGEQGPRVLSYTTLQYSSKDRPKELGPDHERMWATSIRPFILGDKTYLSIYVPWAVEDSKQRKEWMWVMRYLGGGRNLGKEGWQPARVEKLCRFAMVVTKH